MHALFIINEEAHIRELGRVAELLLERSRLRPVVFLEDRLKHLGAPEIFQKLGVEVLTSDAFSGGDGAAALGVHGSAARRRRAQLVLDAAGRLVKRYPDRYPEIQNNHYYIELNRDLMLKRAAVCQAVLSQRDYACIVTCEDNVELDTSVWVLVARKLGVRSIIVPYTISNIVEFAESYVRHEPYQAGANMANRLAALLFPRWLLRYKGRRILRMPYGKVFATELLGLTPPNPWLLNSGFVDAIAVESEAMREYYLAAGIPAEQLAVTGSLADDVLADVSRNAAPRRRALLEQFGMSQDRPLLLAALPPDQNTFDRPGCEFSNFDDMIDYWGQTLSRIEGWNVVVRPHPKIAPGRLSALTRHGVAVSYEDTAALVPLCDLYVATVSATIRWAIRCGKPVVNYDVYRYGYEDYKGIDGVWLVNTKDEFAKALSVVTTDAAARQKLGDEQQRQAARWGFLDGRSGDRLLSLLERGKQAA